MTPDEFAKHLTTQPWAHSYITNLLNNGRQSFKMSNYLHSSFVYSRTDEKYEFWFGIEKSNNYGTVPNLITSDTLIEALIKHFPNNPELFI